MNRISQSSLISFKHTLNFGSSSAVETDFNLPTLVIQLNSFEIIIFLSVLIKIIKTPFIQMNKKINKIKNRLVQTIQANYSLSDSNQKHRNSSTNSKLKTLLTEKAADLNHSSLKSKSKRVYLTDISQTLKAKNQYEDRGEKEEFLKTKNQQTQHRYMVRTKSSNGISNNRSLRQSSKMTKINKNINIQFQNELYWNGNNSYLVTGVKNQYQKMKKIFQQKCIQIELIKQQFKVNTVNQMKIQIEMLRKQNSRILEAWEKQRAKHLKSSSTKSNVTKIITENLQDQSGDIEMQLQQKIQKVQKKCFQLQKKSSSAIKQNKNLLLKIQILDKLIIQKENNQFRTASKFKKLQKSQLQLRNILQNLQQKIKKQQNNHHQVVSQIKNRLRAQYQSKQKQLSLQVKQKNIKIQKLQKQIMHLKVLVEQWKQNQASLNLQQEQNTQKSRDLTQIFNNSHTKLSLELQTDRLKVRNQNLKIKFKNSIENDYQTNFSNNNISNMLSQRSLNKSGFKNHTKGSGRQTESMIKRQRVTATTHNSASVKCRPVELNEIQHIVEYLRLKLAYKKVDPGEIRTYFQFDRKYEIHLSLNDIPKYNPKGPLMNKQIQNYEGQNDKLSWEEEYITIKEVYQIFLKEPFSLKDAQALLLSRFIIEDVKESYIYMNWNSQNSRRMVQSIISNLVAKYSILNQSTRQKAQQFLKRYGVNIIPALKSISGKSGKVTLQKFIQILNGLGLERSSHMEQYIIGKMCSQSQTLQQLQFQILYKQKL